MREIIMSIDGFVDYKRREYCNDIKCDIQMKMNKAGEGTPDYDSLRDVCKKDCIHSTYEFHHWLIENGYFVVRPNSED